MERYPEWTTPIVIPLNALSDTGLALAWVVLKHVLVERGLEMPYGVASQRARSIAMAGFA
jgi:hypothetical protein